MTGATSGIDTELYKKAKAPCLLNQLNDLLRFCYEALLICRASPFCGHASTFLQCEEAALLSGGPGSLGNDSTITYQSGLRTVCPGLTDTDESSGASLYLHLPKPLPRRPGPLLPQQSGAPFCPAGSGLPHGRAPPPSCHSTARHHAALIAAALAPPALDHQGRRPRWTSRTHLCDRRW